MTLVRDGAFHWLNKLTRRDRLAGPYPEVAAEVVLPPPRRPFTAEEKEAMLKLGAPHPQPTDI